MMDYEMFKEVFKETFKNYLGEEYKDADVIVEKQDKVNITVDAACVVPKTKEMCLPVFYLNNMYEHYQECGNLNEVFGETAKVLDKAMDEVPDITGKLLNVSDIKDKIYYQLINKEQNETLLEKVPHREFEDLALIYRWLVDNPDRAVMSIIIKDSAMNYLNLDEKGLYDIASKNTEVLFPTVIRTMEDIINDIFRNDGIEQDIIGSVMSDVPEEQKMYVITNNTGINGASAMLNTDKLAELSEKLGSDLYIMPSSTHETIAISSNFAEPYELAEIVNEVNMAQVSLEERLSNNVYRFDKESRTLELATKDLNRRIDGRGGDKEVGIETKREGR